MDEIGADLFEQVLQEVVQHCYLEAHKLVSSFEPEQMIKGAVYASFAKMMKEQMESMGENL